MEQSEVISLSELISRIEELKVILIKSNIKEKDCLLRMEFLGYTKDEIGNTNTTKEIRKVFPK